MSFWAAPTSSPLIRPTLIVGRTSPSRWLRSSPPTRSSREGDHVPYLIVWILTTCGAPVVADRVGLDLRSFRSMPALQRPNAAATQRNRTVMPNNRYEIERHGLASTPPTPQTSVRRTGTGLRAWGARPEP